MTITLIYIHVVEIEFVEDFPSFLVVGVDVVLKIARNLVRVTTK